MMLNLKRPLLRGPALILGVGMCFAALGALGTVYGIWTSRDVAIRQNETRLLATAHMLNAHAIQSLEAADMMLRRVNDNLKELHGLDEAKFQEAVSAEHIFYMMRAATHGVPQVAGISLIANNGRLLNFTRQFPPPDLSLHDQDYFLSHAADPQLNLFIGRLTKNRITHAPYFYVARKLNSDTGQNLGLIVTGISTEFFNHFYQSAILGDMRITLFRDDGSILARNFDVSDLEENRTQINPAVFRLINGVESRTGLTGGQETLDSFNEMWAVERSSYLPIGIMASLPRELVLREWENQAIRFVIIGGTLSAILILLTLILARLVRQLEQTRNSALAAAGAKSRFVASVSHELRTPMNAIIGGAHQLLQTKLTPDAERYVQLVSSSAQQLTVLINDILDFSYFESRDFRIEKAPFEPRNMAHNAMEMTRALVPNSKLELIYKVDEKVPPFIIGDSSRIKQVILNLLSNAVKYTERGQVELRISYMRGKENLLILQVHDTGPGISPEDQTRIFEPFERTNAARKRPGTGLGLTISKKLVEAMKGTISLTSTLGQGACFTIELPAPPASAFEAKIDATKPPVDFSKILRILVAEDVAPSRVLLTVMLTNLGHNVTAVENGLEALQIASEMPFDLILMDLQMPEMDGVTATQRIRASKGPNRHTRILAVSANADVDGPNGLAAAGFDDALLKPIKPERLRFLLNEIVAQI